jgi:2-aminoadipate transaminase
MSHHRREQLVQLSLKYHFLILADEVYHFLDYEKKEQNGKIHNDEKLVEHPKSFAAYHAAGTVIALHSFSKILTPSLRLGFAVASHEHVDAMGGHGLIHSGGGANPFISGIVDRILVKGLLKKFIDETLCVEYGKRMRVLHNELMQIFGDKHITCRRPSGGYFLWVKFNDTTVDCDQLLIIARKYGVNFKPGRLFAHDEEAKAHIANCLRLSISIVGCELLREGCARLKKAFEEYKNINLS